jgi:hypothetical protein
MISSYSTKIIIIIIGFIHSIIDSITDFTVSEPILWSKLLPVVLSVDQVGCRWRRLNLRGGGFRGRGKNGRNGWEGTEEIDGGGCFFLPAVCSFLTLWNSSFFPIMELFHKIFGTVTLPLFLWDWFVRPMMELFHKVFGALAIHLRDVMYNEVINNGILRKYFLFMTVFKDFTV